MKTFLRAHPIIIWDFARPLLLVWLLPLIQSVIKQVFTENADLELALEGVAVIWIMLFAYFKWKNYGIAITDAALVIKSGRIIKTKIYISFESFLSVESAIRLPNLIFGGATVWLSAVGQKGRIKLRLSKRDAEMVIKMLVSRNKTRNQGNNTLDVSHET